MTTTLTDSVNATWMTEGACRDKDPDMFFPIGADAGNAEQIQTATSICDRCGVEAECLRYALANRIKEGIWGGRTEQQRQSLLRSRRRRHPRSPAR